MAGDASVMLNKPEEAELKKIRPEMNNLVIQATEVAQMAYRVVGRYLPKDSAMLPALEHAQKPKNIANVQIARLGEEEGMYSMKITLKGEPHILTIRVGEEGMDIMLSDLKNKPIEYLEQKNGKLLFSKQKS